MINIKEQENGSTLKNKSIPKYTRVRHKSVEIMA